jgi:peptidoglycan/xylan/chitin deacetylase (PgdA/CDA1 family)
MVVGGLASLLFALAQRRSPATAAALAPDIPADGAASGPPPLTADAVVGSAAVMAALWTADDLKGRAEEARIRRQRPPDRTPPDAVEAPPLPPLPPARQGSIRRLRPAGDAKPVALTFDLCERADDATGYDGAVVDALRADLVPATFFAGGKWMRSHPERARQLIADPLFEVGNHAWSHGNLRVLAEAAAMQQIAWTQAEYARLRQDVAARAAAAGVDQAAVAAIPPAPALFRFPYGVCRDETLALANRLGLAAIQWDVISGDAVAGTRPGAVEAAVMAGVRPGSIVVFHANGRGAGTALALPAIIRQLRARGYRLVTVSTLLAAGMPVAAAECYEQRPGDNRRYDRLFGDGTG